MRMMELTDYTVYLWLWPAAVHLFIPLAVSCIGLGVFLLKRVGGKEVDNRAGVPGPSSA
jgi:hypothetical protein